MSLTPKFPVFLHGGDYNPDQWLDRPDILQRDVELMEKAHVNCVSLGIFSWALLEPEEGVYQLDWLGEIIDRLWQHGIRTILATPSGARPAWMAQKYPEVLRVDAHFRRRHFGERHNHCPSSPVFREKTAAIDRALAERFASHPAVILWHLSNELSGDCFCPLCQQRFREWLQRRYGTLDALNAAWWTGFWSMRYTDWQQIEPPSPEGQMSNLGMRLDWRRFSTDQCRDFIRWERDTVQAVNPELPVTVNLMHRFWDYDYFALAEDIDVVSWDSYPEWHTKPEIETAAEYGMWHDMMRSLKDQPFLLMESTPSLVNWKDVNKLKKPGMHLLSSLQAVAHGSDSVQYFQWRKGRGGAEMFHGAVVDHSGRDDTRTFRQVTEVGLALEKLQAVHGAPVEAQCCILYDWENRWALDMVQAARRGDMRYTETVTAHWRELWKRGISVDFRDLRACTDLSRYRLVIAPLLFMLRGGIEEKLRAFVEGGGTLLMTCFSGVVNEDDLAFLGDAPHGLTDVLGLRAEELDTLGDDESNEMRFADGRCGRLIRLCEVVVPQGCEAVAVYGSDYYAGQPCLTRHAYGQGQAWYLAAEPDAASLGVVYDELLRGLSLPRALNVPLPEGVVAVRRGSAVFLQNYTGTRQRIGLPHPFRDLLTGQEAAEFLLPAFGVAVLEER